jgi:hypothetical protein
MWFFFVSEVRARMVEKSRDDAVMVNAETVLATGHGNGCAARARY